MSDFTFRYRFQLAQRSGISSDEAALELHKRPDGGSVVLTTTDGAPLLKGKNVVLRAPAWPTAEAAEAAGKRYSDILKIALARHRVGADLIGRSGKGLFFKHGLKMLEEQHGGRVLNDVRGLQVYETDPPPKFAGVGASAMVSVSAAQFSESFDLLTRGAIVLSDRELLAVDLFNLSFFEPSAETRLLTLIMAIESLLELKPRTKEAVELVNSFIGAVAGSSLGGNEKQSLTTSLEWLRLQSIGSAGRELAELRLGNREYFDKPAKTFFSYCYSLRGRLVHGGVPRPTETEIGTAAANLELFVSDLLTAPYLPPRPA